MDVKSLPTELVATVPCKQGAVRAARYNVDGTYALTCGSDKSVKLWRPSRSLMLTTLMGHGAEVLDACGSCDNASVGSGGQDKAVLVHDVESGKVLRRWRQHAGRVNAVAFNEESTLIFSASVDGCVKCFDCKSRSQQPVQTLDEATDSVDCVSVTDYEILTGSADKRARRYDLRAGKMMVDFLAKPVTSCGFTRDGQCALLSTLDGHVRLLDKHTGELLATFTGHKNLEYKIDSVLLASDAHVVSGSEDGIVYIWDLVEAVVTARLPHAGAKTVHSISAHPKKQQLLTAAGQNMHLWQTQSEVDGDDL